MNGVRLIRGPTNNGRLDDSIKKKPVITGQKVVITDQKQVITGQKPVKPTSKSPNFHFMSNYHLTLCI